VVVVIMLVLISLALVVIALVFFASRLKGGDFEHGDRLSLLPLRDDESSHAMRADAADTNGAPTIEADHTIQTDKEESPPHASKP
jgi:nitrogen fixation-related uncharacterized protein